MLQAVQGTSVGVKVSGGIRTYEQAKHFIDMGCQRIGTSSIEVIHA
jgi:deoxyribose-phosphate aldolase